MAEEWEGKPDFRSRQGQDYASAVVSVILPDLLLSHGVDTHWQGAKFRFWVLPLTCYGLCKCVWSLWIT